MLDVQNVDAFISAGNRISDRHDRELFDQHRGVLHHRLLLQLEADPGGPLLPASHRPVGGLPGKDADRLRKRGQEGDGVCGSGETYFKSAGRDKIQRRVKISSRTKRLPV